MGIYWGYFSYQIGWGQLEVIRYTFHNFWCYDFQNVTLPTVLKWFQQNFMWTLITMGEYTLSHSFVICPFLIQLSDFDFFLTQDHIWGWKFQTTTPTVFLQFQENLILNMLVMEKHGLLISWWSAKYQNNYYTLKIEHGNRWEILRCEASQEQHIAKRTETLGLVGLWSIYT